MMFRAQYRKFSSYEAIVLSRTVNLGSNHAGVRWYELRKTGSTWTIYQQGTYAPDADSRWMSSAAMNADGDIALGYSVSGASTYPSIRYTGRLAGDALGTMTITEGTIFTGSTYQYLGAGYSNRWGDYSMMSVDPADDHSFWYTQEYTSGGWNWRTRIAEFQFTSPASPPISDFTADNTLPANASTTVNFTNLSTNSPTYNLWTFNPSTVTYMGGTNANSENPSVRFNNYGAYTVTLYVQNAYGNNTQIKTAYIHMGQPGLWTGTASPGWSTTTNWQNELVPDAATAVTVDPTASNWPVKTGNLTVGTDCYNLVLTGGTELTVTGDLTINTGKILNTSGVTTLKVGGNWTNNGTFNAGTGTVEFNGTSASMIIITGSSTGGGKADNSGGGGYYGTATYNIFNCTTAFTLISAKVYASVSGDRTFYWANSSGTVQQQTTINVPAGESRVTLNFNISPGSNHRLGVSSSSPNLYRNNSGVSYPYPIGSFGSVVNSAAGTPYYYFCYDLEYSSGSTAETYYNLVLSKTINPVSTNSDVSVNNNFTIKPSAYFTNATGNTINVAGNMLLEADASGMASYIDNGTTNVSGSTMVQEYLTSERWHLVSPPVAGATINTYLDIYLKYYNEPSATWTYLVNPTTLPMNLAQGYSAWAADDMTGTTTATYTGTLNNSNYSIGSLSYTASAAPSDGFNLIGNPFPCAIDWSMGWPMNNLSGWMEIYDNGVYRGYHVDGSSYNGGTQLIPSNQGFWVRAINTSASITIPSSARVHSGQAFYKDTPEISYPEIRLNATMNGNIDEAVIAFMPDGSEGFNGYYDLEKFYNAPEFPQFYSILDSRQYAFKALPADYENRLIPLGFEMVQAGTFQLQASEIKNFDPDINVYLEDLLTGQVTELKEGQQITFTSSPLDDPHRFNLHFMKSYYGVNEESLSSTSIYSINDIVYIQMPFAASGEVVIYDLTGHEMIRQAMRGTALVKIKVDFKTGYYLVKVQTGDQFITGKVFLHP